MATKLRTVIIPAAGNGTQLVPATRVTAKELLPVYDHVAIDFAMAEAIEAGAERIIVVINETKTAIRDYLESDPKFSRPGFQRSALGAMPDATSGSPQVEYVYQIRARGLGDAILCCEDRMLPGPFGVILPDDGIFGAGCLAQMAAHRLEGHMVAAMQVNSNATSQYGIFQVRAASNERCVPVLGMVENLHLELRHPCLRPSGVTS